MIHTISIEVSLQDLTKVLNQTGNPQVAAEILNGTYQEPEFDKSDRTLSPNKDGERYRYICVGYNIWTDEVIYKVQIPESWDKTISRGQWEKLELWEHVMNSQAHELVS